MRWLLALPLPVWALGPGNLLVVVNRNSAASSEIASYYTRARRIPAANHCTIGAPLTEWVARAVYEKEIEAPVRRCIAARPPGADPILVLVTTQGVPLAVEGTPSLNDGPESERASVDSELAASFKRPASLKGNHPNPFFGKVQSTFDQRPFPMYLVARLAAYDVAGVKKMIDRSIAASNRGTFVFDLHEPPPGNMADGWLVSAAAQLPRARVKIDSTTEVLYGEKDVIGYASWGSNDKARKKRWSSFRFLPGAVVTEFVSTNLRTLERPPANWNIGTWADRQGYFARSPQSMAPDYLEEGASAVTGHVAEPFLTYAPRPDYLFPAYHSGRTLAESYWTSVPALSWMNVLLGDPLMRLEPARAILGKFARPARRVKLLLFPLPLADAKSSGLLRAPEFSQPDYAYPAGHPIDVFDPCGSVVRCARDRSVFQAEGGGEEDWVGPPETGAAGRGESVEGAHLCGFDRGRRHRRRRPGGAQGGRGGSRAIERFGGGGGCGNRPRVDGREPEARLQARVHTVLDDQDLRRPGRVERRAHRA
ncbi:MAG: TIGR03790 family protein [Acidobacteria bacterium]|nr:TIGR03790 family protein [Acidobacteriota bacterium]